MKTLFLILLAANAQIAFAAQPSDNELKAFLTSHIPRPAGSENFEEQHKFAQSAKIENCEDIGHEQYACVWSSNRGLVSMTFSKNEKGLALASTK